MRQRRIKNQEERLNSLIDRGIVIDVPEDHRGSWLDLFNRDDAKLFVEIGCGKGKFIVEKARRNPQDCFLAVEIQGSAIVLSGEKHDEGDNLIFIHKKINLPSDIFQEEEVDGIFLNFSDPWPKKRHVKRRLTSEDFLRAYSRILRPGGVIEIKTDNEGLYEFTCEELDRLGEELGFDIEVDTTDLHNSRYDMDNIRTEYEEKFSNRGKNIYYLVIKKRG